MSQILKAIKAGKPCEVSEKIYFKEYNEIKEKLTKGKLYVLSVSTDMIHLELEIN